MVSYNKKRVCGDIWFEDLKLFQLYGKEGGKMKEKMYLLLIGALCGIVLMMSLGSSPAFPDHVVFGGTVNVKVVEMPGIKMDMNSPPMVMKCK